jgi:hypothetical protein
MKGDSLSLIARVCIGTHIPDLCFLLTDLMRLDVDIDDTLLDDSGFFSQR